MADIKIEDILRRLPLFNDMGPEDLARLAAGAKKIQAPRGTMLFHRGDHPVGFHVVVFGQVKLFFTSVQGAEKVVEILGPGQSFGEALMFLEKPYIVDAQTLADSLLLHISKSVVFDGLSRDPQFSRKLIAGLSRRLHGLIRDIEAYSLRSGRERVIGYLLRGEGKDIGETNRITLTLPASKNVIASRLNLAPETLSRILNELMEAGLIEVKGRTVTILDMDHLAQH